MKQIYRISIVFFLLLLSAFPLCQAQDANMNDNISSLSFADSTAISPNDLTNATIEATTIVTKFMNLLKEEKTHLLYFIIICLAQIGLIYITNRFYKWSKTFIAKKFKGKLKAFKIQNYEILNTSKQLRLLLTGSNLFRYLLIIIQLIFTVPLIFSIFPATEKVADTLFSYIWNPIHNIILGLIDYLPKLFAIIITIYVTRYILKMMRYFTNEIETGRLHINGFYPDWAQPTFHILRAFLYIIIAAIIYRYLPNADSNIFQGITVLVGLVVSLGSTSVISNLMAGLVMTYMRPFKIDDRIKIGDKEGKILEKTALVTRLLTPKNEIVTVPNSFILSEATVNYSRSARKFGLIIHSDITIGYDVPWRKVHAMLIEAANATDEVTKEPKPFVLETALNDWYVVYQLNAYISDATHLPKIYSNLHQNIQDIFNRNEIEIMSPQYVATRNGNKSTVVTETNTEMKEPKEKS